MRRRRRRALPASARGRVLAIASFAFACSFTAWFALGPLMGPVSIALGLSDVQIGWLATAGVALTIPARLLTGVLVDRLGARVSYAILLLVVAVPVALCGLATSFDQLLVLRLLVGLAGCGFVIGIRLISDWFPRERFGLAEGIYGGVGNAGSAVAALALPAIAIFAGWRIALACAALPLLAGAVAMLGVSDVPAGRVLRRPLREAGYSPWRDRRALILSLAYLAAFGSEICVIHFLPRMFAIKYGASLASAGAMAGIFGAVNLIARPLGGHLSDKLGRRRVLVTTLTGATVGYCLLAVSTTLPVAIAGVIVTSLFVDAAAGAVFAIVPALQPSSTGRVAGLVGAAGNVGGVLFPPIFGYGLAATGGSYAPGFVAAAIAVGVAALFATRLDVPQHAPAAPAVAHGARVPMQAERSAS